MSKSLKSIGRVATASALAVSAVAVATPAHADTFSTGFGKVTIPVNTTNLKSALNDITTGAIPSVSKVVPGNSTLQSGALQSITSNPQKALKSVTNRASSVGQAIVNAAASKEGSPYAWGAAGPNSFDCSGLVYWAYQQVGKTIPRTSQAMAASGIRVSLDALQPGDIIAYYSGASHVGIYTGHGTIIDALNQGTVVQERSLHYMPIHSAVRF